MSRNCNRWVPKERTGVLFPGGMRFHELPESAGRWCRRNTRLTAKGYKILGKSQTLWTTVQLQPMRRLCRNMVS